MLYILYTADLPELPNGSQLYLYADDTAITTKGRTLGELYNNAQRSLNFVLEYAVEWKIKLNERKTQAMIVPYRMKK